MVEEVFALFPGNVESYRILLNDQPCDGAFHGTEMSASVKVQERRVEEV